MQSAEAYDGLSPNAKLPAYIQVTFFPKGEPEKVYGQIVQKYYQN